LLLVICSRHVMHAATDVNACRAINAGLLLSSTLAHLSISPGSRPTCSPAPVIAHDHGSSPQTPFSLRPTSDRRNPPVHSSSLETAADTINQLVAHTSTPVSRLALALSYMRRIGFYASSRHGENAVQHTRDRCKPPHPSSHGQLRKRSARPMRASRLNSAEQRFEKAQPSRLRNLSYAYFPIMIQGQGLILTPRHQPTGDQLSTTRISIAWAVSIPA